MLETIRTLETELGLTPEQTVHLQDELKAHFADACEEGYETFVTAMGNNAKDRHVLAAAVRSGSQTIVTFNLKHFPVDALELWNVEAQSPDEFLIHQFRLEPGVVTEKINEHAARHGGLDRLLAIHNKTVPKFVALLRKKT
jgi:hypothetical protein